MISKFYEVEFIRVNQYDPCHQCSCILNDTYDSMNNALTCTILDDEPLSVKLLTNYVDLTPGLQLIFSSTSASQAIEFFKHNNADLLFLDIQMPEINGLEIGKALTHKTRIILTSAYQEYAINGYDLNVIDF